MKVLKMIYNIQRLLIVLSVMLMSIQVYGQCDFYLEIVVNAENFEPSNTQNYVLVADSSGFPGSILAVNTSGTFTGFPSGPYWVYAVNFEGSTPSQLAVGLSWTGVVNYDAVSTNCIDILEAYHGGSINLCDPYSICEPDSIQVNTINEFVGAGYTQDFVLVNSSDQIIAFNTDGVFPIGDYISEGDFQIYAVNTNDASVLSEISDLGPWMDVQDLLAGPKCLDILMPVYLEVLDENDPSCSLLPVELLWFTGEKVNETNVLKWQTATEINSDYFEVLSSSDALNFNKIGQVDAQGQSNTIQSYHFVDVDPVAATTYYKLRAVDLDLSFSYTNIIVLSREEEGHFELTLYPNPAQNVLSLEISAEFDEKFELELIDVLGKRMGFKSIRVTPNQQGRVQWDLNNLANGTYEVFVRSETHVVSKKFIKID